MINFWPFVCRWCSNTRARNPLTLVTSYQYSTWSSRGNRLGPEYRINNLLTKSPFSFVPFLPIEADMSFWRIQDRLISLAASCDVYVSGLRVRIENTGTLENLEPCLSGNSDPGCGLAMDLLVKFGMLSRKRCNDTFATAISQLSRERFSQMGRSRLAGLSFLDGAKVANQGGKDPCCEFAPWFEASVIGSGKSKT